MRSPVYKNESETAKKDFERFVWKISSIFEKFVFWIVFLDMINILTKKQIFDCQDDNLRVVMKTTSKNNILIYYNH